MASRLESLIAIATLLAPKAKRIAADVTRAFEEPEAYFKTHAKRLGDRSIDEPDADLPWIALIDGLIAARKLSEIDWKTDAEDLAWSLETLGVSKRNTAWLRAIDEVADDRSTLELLEEAGQKLLAADLQLAALDIGSDSYCLVVVPSDQAKNLVALAKAARYGTADLFTGKGLAAAKRERIARDERQRKEAARAAKRAAKEYEKYRYFARGKATWYIGPHALAFDTGFEAPKKKFYANHYFKDRKACAAAGVAQVTAWTADGFTEIDRDSYLARCIADSAYIGWVGPFPRHAHYWLESKRIVRALALEGDAIWSAGGMVGRDFAELQSFTHFKTPELAARAFQVQLDAYNTPGFYKPIERAALLKLYK